MKIETKKTLIAGARMIVFIAFYYGAFLGLKALVDRKVLTGQEALAYRA